MPESSDLHRPHGKTRDRSLVLVLVGTMLLMPPLAGIALIDGRLFGMPIPLLYVFVVWGLLIAGTAWLSRRLDQGAAGAAPPPTSEGEP
jgi:hypothetical protein